VPCLWDAVKNDLFFGSTSFPHADRMAALFGLSFMANLVDQKPLATGALIPRTAATIAEEFYPKAKDERLSCFVPGTTPDEIAWCPAEGDISFLGNEFLLWLWYYGQTDSDTVKTPDGSDVTFMFSGGIRLQCPRGQTGDDTINHDSGVRTPEARAALKTGKLPRKAALTVVRHDDQYSFKLNAETLAISGARLPKPDGDVTAGRRTSTASAASRDLAEIVEQLYLAFLGRRLSGYWAQELAEMQGWIKAAKVPA
jgi:hypothetical protein